MVFDVGVTDWSWVLGIFLKTGNVSCIMNLHSCCVKGMLSTKVKIHTLEYKIKVYM